MSSGAGTDAPTSKFSKVKNPFGVSDNAFGCFILVLAAFIASMDSVMIDVAEDNGVTANSMTFYASICTLLGSTGVDAYYWYYGYGDGCHVCLS